MTIGGIVQDVFSDQYATYIVIERDDNRKMLAIRCWQKSQRAEAEKLRPGDRVEVTGEVSSRASKNDPRRWFTNYEATALRTLGEGRGEPAPDDEGPEEGRGW